MLDHAHHLEQFTQDGYTVFRHVLDTDLIKEVHGHVEWLQGRHPGVRPEDLGHRYLRDDPFWLRLVSDDRLLDIARLFVGDDIALFASHYICKPPFDGRAVSWHQDGAFWPLEPVRVVTLWLAVDESDSGNGCLRVVPGSHRLGIEQMRESVATPNVLGMEIAREVDESEAADIILEPGDVEVHHPNIIHGSAANTSPRRRCGLTIRYIPTSTRITDPEQPYPSAFLLRGEPGVNRYQEWPAFRVGEHFPYRGA